MRGKRENGLIVRAEQVGRSVRCAREAWYRARGMELGAGSGEEVAVERLLSYGKRREAEYFTRQSSAMEQVSGALIWLGLIVLFLVLVFLGGVLLSGRVN